MQYLNDTVHMFAPPEDRQVSDRELMILFYDFLFPYRHELRGGIAVVEIEEIRQICFIHEDRLNWVEVTAQWLKGNWLRWYSTAFKVQTDIPPSVWTRVASHICPSAKMLCCPCVHCSEYYDIREACPHLKIPERTC